MAPGPQPGRRAGRGALQGDPAGLRHALGRGEAQAVRRRRPLRRLRRRRLPRRRRRLPGRRLRLGPRRHLLHVLPRARSAGPAASSGAATSRREVRLSFDQAMHGTQIAVSVPTTGECPTCHGSGAKPGTSPRTCPRCEGTGHRRPEPGPLLDLPALPRVRWPGVDHRRPLPDLLRQRRDRRRPSATASTSRPASTTAAGSGSPARARPATAAGRAVTSTSRPGSPPPRSSSSAPDGNLEVDLPVTVTEAIQGGDIEVPTLNGSKTIRIAPGTQHGTVQRLRGEGPPAHQGLGAAATSTTGSASTSRRSSPTSSARRWRSSPSRSTAAIPRALARFGHGRGHPAQEGKLRTDG